MSGGRRLDWRGSSGSLWGRGRDHGSGTDNLDLLNGARHIVPPSGDGRSATHGRPRRKGLRKRFLSLTEGLTNFLSGDKKEKEPVKRSAFRPFDHSTDLDVDLVSGYCSDYSSDCRTEYRRKNSNSSVSSFKRSVSPWSGPVNGRSGGQLVSGAATQGGPLASAKPQGPVKAPPSPPPRRYSLWAMDVQYDHYFFPDPLRPNAPVSYVPPAPPPVKQPPPPPPIRYFNLAPPVSSSMSRQTSPRPYQPPSPSVARLLSAKRACSPPSPRSHSPFRGGTPPTPRVSTPLGSPVLRGRSKSDSRTESSRAGSESRGHDSRAAWYRRKSQARKRAQSR